jgi:hypothetical protein
MSELKAAARSWFDQGFNVVAFRFKIDDEGELSKQPLIEWNKWKSQRQTLEEFENQPWSISDGFGVVCGYPNAEGLFLAVVDYDVKKVSEDAKKRGEKLLERFPITRIERTISGGLHYVYFSRVKPNLISETHDSCALELIAGPSKLCVMAPSKGYKTLNDNPPRVVEDAEELFREIVKLPDPRKAKIGAESRGKLEKWLEILKEHLDVAGEGSNYIYAHCPFHPPDKHPSFAINKVKFYAVDYHDGEVFSLKDLAKALNINLPDSDGEGNKEESVEKAVFLELPDGRLVEGCFDGEEFYFVIYDPQSGSIEKSKEIKVGEKTYTPLESDEAKFGLVLLPSGVEDYGSEESLRAEILDFLNKWHEAPDEKTRKIDLNYIFLTYIQDLVPQVPYLRNLALWGGGKTTWLEVAGSISYRPIFLSGCDTDKSICRMLHLWRGTAIIDEADFSDSSLYAFIIKLLNIAYDRKKGWYHRCDDFDPFKIISYYVYGCKYLATRGRFKDAALESRCITIHGRENRGRVPLYRLKQFEEEALRLRNRLLLWRFRNYHKFKELGEALEKPNLTDEIFGSNNCIPSRIKQILLPLYLVSDENVRRELAELANELNGEIRILDRDLSLIDAAKEALKNLIDEGKKAEVKGGFVKVKLSDLSGEIVKNESSEEFAETGEISLEAKKSISKKLSQILVNRLGFKLEVGKARARYIYIPRDWAKGELGEFSECSLGRREEPFSSKKSLGVNLDRFAIEHSPNSPNSPISKDKRATEEAGEDEKVTGVTRVTDFSNSEKCDQQAELKQKEEDEFFKKYKTPVTSATPVTLKQDEPSGPRIDVYKCGDCGFWAANRCGLRREWVVVLPNHPACGSFKPRGAADGADSL